MAGDMWTAGAGPQPTQPRIRRIHVADLKDVLARGLDDFKAKPSYVVLLLIIYPLDGFLLFILEFNNDLLPLVFPLIAGFALVGPLAAIGLYELSRIREQGFDIPWWKAAGVFRSPTIGAIVELSIVQLLIYVAWLAAALEIYRRTFGDAMPTSITVFAHDVLATSSGWALMLVGCGISLIFAVVMLTISVVSFPLLIDRDVGAVFAVRTSVRAVLKNPMTMAIWGLIVVALLVIGSLPVLVGLALVMPVLGHATWHLYRKVVEF